MGDSVFWSRALTELTLTFHVIFATLRVGVPSLYLVFKFFILDKRYVSGEKETHI